VTAVMYLFIINKRKKKKKIKRKKILNQEKSIKEKEKC